MKNGTRKSRQYKPYVVISVNYDFTDEKILIEAEVTAKEEIKVFDPPIDIALHFLKKRGLIKDFHFEGKDTVLIIDDEDFTGDKEVYMTDFFDSDMKEILQASIIDWVEAKEQLEAEAKSIFSIENKKVA